MATGAKLLVSMLDELGGITDEPGRLTRTFLSPAMEQTVNLVGVWMQDAAMEVRTDAVGNLIGRWKSTSPHAKTLLIGSHLDTVHDAGRFDGPLGVLLPIVALGELRRRGVKLPFHVEVIGFSEEEGVRYSKSYLGSEGYTGRLQKSSLDLRDAAGVSLKEALAEFNDARFVLPKPAHAKGELLGHLEVHIEQGPVLETRGLAVGVVSAIAGQSRFKLTWTGKAGHAGTTPMALRRDALAGAAEFALAVEKFARGTKDLVATIGSLTVSPGASNVIPGEVVHSLDVRHARDAARKAALFKLGRLAAQIARRRGLKVAWKRTQDHGAIACAPQLTALLERSVQAVQGKSLSLVSGAGHDGVVMSTLTPVAMLFVRCRDGLSHHPDEYAAPKDIGVALDVVIDFLQRLATEQTK